MAHCPDAHVPCALCHGTLIDVSAVLQLSFNAMMPAVGNLSHFLVVSLDDGEIDKRPLCKVLIALNVLGVAEYLAVGINLLDGSNDLVEKDHVLLGRFDFFQEMFRHLPIFQKGVFCMELVVSSFSFSQVRDDVLDVKLNGMTEIEAYGINDKVNWNASTFNVGEDYFRPLEVALGVIVEVVWSAVRPHAGIEIGLLAHKTLEDVVLFEALRGHVAPQCEIPL